MEVRFEDFSWFLSPTVVGLMLAGVLAGALSVDVIPFVSVVLSELAMADSWLEDAVIGLVLSCTEAIFSATAEAQGPG